MSRFIDKRRVYLVTLCSVYAGLCLYSALKAVVGYGQTEALTMRSLVSTAMRQPVWDEEAQKA